MPPAGARVGTCFGLDIHSNSPLAMLQGAAAAPTGRSIYIRTQPHPEEMHASDRSTLLCDELSADGDDGFRIWAEADGGYLLSGPKHGKHRLSRDGRQLRCLPGSTADRRWQRLLIAQALPFAALLQGLEVLHASAVVRDRCAIGFLGPSGVGKSSLALELTRRGAEFLADDVLAVEHRSCGLVAHPGTPLASVIDHSPNDDNATQLPSGTEHVVAALPGERMLAVRAAREPAVLSHLFLMQRDSRATSKPAFESLADPRLLLTATFNFILVTPQRLQRLLEVSALAAQGTVECVRFGAATSACDLATEIERRLG